MNPFIFDIDLPFYEFMNDTRRMIMRNCDLPLNFSITEVIKNTDINRLEEMIVDGIDLNSPNNKGYVPLHFASYFNNFSVSKFLIDYGADVNFKDFALVTPLHYASCWGAYDVAKLLIDRGADIEAEDIYGTRPLHVAVERNNSVLTQLLLERGARSNVKTILDVTPCHLAAYNNSSIIIEKLIKHYGYPDAPINCLETPLHVACRIGAFDSVKVLIESTSKERCRYMVNWKNHKSYTPLHVLSEYGNRIPCSYDIASFLFEYGLAEPNTLDNNHNTPLHLASIKGDINMARLLITHRANIHAKNKYGKTPIYEAVIADQVEMVKFLMESGANPNDDVYSTTLLDSARKQSNEIYSFLLHNGGRHSPIYEASQVTKTIKYPPC